MSKNQFCKRNWFSFSVPKQNLAHVFSFRFTHFLRCHLTGFIFSSSLQNNTQNSTERIVKCHPYLWLAPHLPLVPCLNPPSACYIYIVMRASLLTKHFLFDCTHKKELTNCSRVNSSRKFQWIFSVFWWCRLYYSTSNLKDFSSSLSCPSFLMFSLENFFRISRF